MNKVIITSVASTIILTAVGAFSALSAYNMGFDKGYEVANKTMAHANIAQANHPNYHQNRPTPKVVNTSVVHNGKVGHAGIDTNSEDYLSKVSESIIKTYDICKETTNDCSGISKAMLETINVLAVRCEQGTKEACTIASSMKKSLDIS